MYEYETIRDVGCYFSTDMEEGKTWPVSDKA